MIVDGWIDWAIEAPGIPDKVYTQPNNGEMIACHSIVGNYQSALSRFLSEARNVDGRYTKNAAASVMFILCKNGDLLQMYDVFSSTWTSGSREANTRSWAIELEGGPIGNTREPMTVAQVRTFVRLVREWEAFTGRKGVPGQTIFQHHELVSRFGGGATACASDRYDRGWAALKEDDMTPEEVKALVAQYLTEFPPVDTRLREVMQARSDMVALAFGDVEQLLDAHDELDELGYFDDLDD